MPFDPITVRRVYDRRAATFDLFVDLASLGRDRSIRAGYARRLQARAGQTILDVGCGTGRDTRVLGDGAVFVGVDVSRGMLGKAPRSPCFLYIQADAAYLPVKAGSVDAVLCTYTLSTVGHWRLSLREMIRSLRAGGRLVLSEDRLPPGWYMGPMAMLLHLLRYGWVAIEGPLWRSLRSRLTACRRGSALFGLLYWMEGTKP